MKQACILLTVLVLTVFALTGCGCRNSKPAATTMPTVTTAPTTQPTTTPTTATTEETLSPTIPDGNGPVSTDATESTAGNSSRSGGMVGGNGVAGAGSGSGITGSIE